MASQVDIINLALLRLGQEQIAAIYPTESSREARLATALWATSRKDVIRSFPWNFAKTTVTLTEVVETPPDWTYVYALPADCLRFLKIIPQSTSSTAPDIEFELRSNKIYTDEAESVGSYVKDVTDTTEYDDRFVSALAYRLAVELALPLTGNTGILQGMTNMYYDVLRQARATDASENRVDPNVGQGLLNARL